MLRAWRHAAVFDVRRGSVVSWLLTITRNLAIDAVRVRRPIAVAPEDLFGLSLVAPGRDPADEVVVREDVGRMRVALTELPDEQRRAVVLAGVWGLTAREIAEREEIPLGTAKTRIRTALGRLPRRSPSRSKQHEASTTSTRQRHRAGAGYRRGRVRVARPTVRAGPSGLRSTHSSSSDPATPHPRVSARSASFGVVGERVVIRSSSGSRTSGSRTRRCRVSRSATTWVK